MIPNRTTTLLFVALLSAGAIACEKSEAAEKKVQAVAPAAEAQAPAEVQLALKTILFELKR
jgi:hypothetical protein